MKSQFDPDVWAALFMILVVGFGGLVFMNMFVNSFTMHGILSIFDQEYNQRCEYFLLPAISNDYALVYEEPGKHMENLTDYFYVNTPKRTSYFDDIMEKVKKSIERDKGIDLGENQKAMGVCWAIGSDNYTNNKIRKCLDDYAKKGYKRAIMSCGSIAYGPYYIGEAEVVFVGS